MKARTTLGIGFLLALCTWASGADVKYTTEMQAGPGMPPMRSTVYVRGDLERHDMNMMGMGEVSTITQCARKQTIIANSRCKAYYVGTTEEIGAPPSPPSPMGRPAGSPRQGGVVVIENDINDTGERKTMLGREARHIVMKMKMEAKEGSCHPGRMEMENDMWVADIPGRAVCTQKGDTPPPGLAQMGGGGCRDKFEMHNRGSGAAMAFRGVPIKTAMTMVMANGQRQTMTMEVTELSTDPLDASLFEPPVGFKQVNSAQEVYTCGMGMGGGMASQMAEAMKAAERESKPAAAPAGQAAAGQAGEAAGRRAGVWLVGVVLTDRSRRVDADRLGKLLVEKIKNTPGFDAVTIEARSAAEIQQEAVTKKCDFVLYGDVTEAKTAGPKIGGLLGRAAGIGGSVEPRHSVRMDYRLATVEPPDQQVARDTLSHNEQAMSLDQATGTFMDKTAERATTDARRWKQQQGK